MATSPPVQAPVTPAEVDKLFRYLSTHPSTPHALSDFQPADAIFVFGRTDPAVANAAMLVHAIQRDGQRLAPLIMLSGGLGKDSGPVLEEYGFPEAAFLAALMVHLGVPREALVIEDQATNGAENCRFGYRALVERLNRTPRRLIVVAHATQARRLTEQLLTAAEADRWPPLTVQTWPTHHRFDPRDPVDRAEAAAEMLRLAEGPGQLNPDGSPFLRPQSDLPPELVDIARRLHAETKAG